MELPFTIVFEPPTRAELAGAPRWASDWLGHLPAWLRWSLPASLALLVTLVA